MEKGDSRYPPSEELERRRGIDEAWETIGRPQDDPPALSGLVVWLARRLGEDPQALARRFHPDTLRRSKYPFAAEPQEDGSTAFKSIGIVEGKQLQHAPTTRGSNRDWARGGIEVKREGGDVP